MAALNQAPGDRAARPAGTVAAEPLAERGVGGALNPDVEPGEGQDEQADKLGVVDRGFAEPLVQRICAQVPNLLDPLLADLRAWCFRLVEAAACVGAAGAPTRGLLRDAERDLADLARALVDEESDLVALSRLPIGAFGARRQLSAAPALSFQDDAVVGEVRLQPMLLGREELLDVGRRAVVLVGRAEQVVLPSHPIGAGDFLVELRRRRRHACLVQRASDCVPLRVVAALRLVGFPDRLLLFERSGCDLPELVLAWKIVGHAVEHGREDACQEPELADGADRHGEGDADRVFGPAAAAQPLNRAPLVDRAHLGALDVLGERAKRVGVIVVLRHQNVDLGETGGDRALHAAVAGDHDQLAVLLAHDRRLDQADRLDVGGQLSVGLRRRLRATGIVGVELQLLRVGDLQFHGSAPSGFTSSSRPLEDPTQQPRSVGLGQRRRAAPGSVLA